MWHSPPKLKVVGSIPRLDARFLPQHVDPPINWAVTWLWSVVKRLELSEIRRYISLQIIIIINVLPHDLCFCKADGKSKVSTSF